MNLIYYTKRHLPAAITAILLSSGAQAQILELMPSGSVSGPSVRLGDIVRDSSRLPIDWAERIVAKAPAPETPGILTLEQIASALHKYPDMHEVTLRGRTTMTLTTDTQRIGSGFISEAVTEYIENHPDWTGLQIQISCDNATIPPLPSGDLSAIITGHRMTADPDRIVVAVDISDGSRILHSMDLRTSVIRMQEFWTVKTDLPRGHVISLNDLSTRLLPAAEVTRGIPDEEQLEGMELTRAVRAGHLLNRAQIAPPVYARRGETIQVVSERGSLTVTIRAKALSTGRRGERIMAVNEASDRKLMVMLTQPREAILEM